MRFFASSKKAIARARHRREAFKKLIDRVAGLKGLDERLRRHARPAEHGRAAHDLGVAANNGLAHEPNISPQ